MPTLVAARAVSVSTRGRRVAIRGVAALAFALPALGTALAQSTAPYPNRPITLVVPYPAGGSADVLARAIGQELGKRLGQTVLVDNRGGAATAIGARLVARAPADGYTLLLGTVSSQAINPAVNKVGYDPVTDFTAIAPIATIPFVLVANPAVPIHSLADVIALAKAKPGELSYASAGIGTSNHLAGELFASEAKLKLLHVPYKGSAPALNDVLGGTVPLMFDLQATALPHIQAGKLNPIAVTSRERSALLPNVPTMIESGLPGFEVSAWFGLFAPAGLPKTVGVRLASEVSAIVSNSQMQKRLRQLGVDPDTSNPDEYPAYVKSEVGKWAATVRSAGLLTQ
ncbi:MAG: tripartite tricarboxylate transporter substrate binding protein [Pseudomonadota bacterium]|nr:tripartite tricarboxylate transporter substrate binding protein [Pseudomonadota bacterium]